MLCLFLIEINILKVKKKLKKIKKIGKELKKIKQGRYENFPYSSLPI